MTQKHDQARKLFSSRRSRRTELEELEFTLKSTPLQCKLIVVSRWVTLDEVLQLCEVADMATHDNEVATTPKHNTLHNEEGKKERKQQDREAQNMHYRLCVAIGVLERL
jgi:hypothetical protein